MWHSGKLLITLGLRDHDMQFNGNLFLYNTHIYHSWRRPSLLLDAFTIVNTGQAFYKARLDNNYCMLVNYVSRKCWLTCCKHNKSYLNSDSKWNMKFSHRSKKMTKKADTTFYACCLWAMFLAILIDNYLQQCGNWENNLQWKYFLKNENLQILS